MAMISQNTIELVKNTADIVDVVGEFVNLQAAGKNMKGLCPFHNEKTPSFFVSKERQTFTCFGCGEKGNAITFVEKYKHISFPEAVKWIADKYRIPLDYDEPTIKKDNITNLFGVNEKAFKFYQLNLLNMSSGKEALNYLYQRGLDLETIEEFELGYAPSTSKALFNQLSNDYLSLDLINAGLINKGENGYYDVFRGRIMFPIRDETNRVIAFSGRVFGNNDNPAKYVNTSQTPIFIKSNVLYNLNRALPFIKRNNRVVLMEGYMDVIKASKAMVKETVCSMGTNLTLDQALKLKEYTNNVIICYDGDNAGKAATAKAINTLEKAKLNVKILAMPDGIDPDEFISNNPNFAEYLDTQTTDQYEFIYKSIVSNHDLSQPSEIEIAKNDIFDFFKNTSGTIRDIYFNRFASEALIDVSVLAGDYNQEQINQRITNSIKTKLVNRRQNLRNLPKFKKAEEVIIKYYFLDKEYRNRVDSLGDTIFFANVNHRSIIITAQEINQTHSTGSFLVAVKSSLNDKLKNLIDVLLDIKVESENFTEFNQCIRTLQVAKLNDDMDFIDHQINDEKQNPNFDEKKIIDMQMKKLEIKHKIINLESEGKIL